MDAGLEYWLREEIRATFDRLGEHGILVWYDPGGTFQELAEGATPEGAHLVRFAGSYLALRHELEERAHELEGRWVLYIPERRPEVSWLRDLEALGERWEVDFLEVVHRKYGLPITPRLSSLLREHPENARALIHAWLHRSPAGLTGEDPVVQALLGCVLGLSSWDPVEALLLFLSESGWRERLDARGLWEEWRRWVADYSGLREPPEDEAGLRDRLGAAALLGEFCRFAPGLESAFVFLPPDEGGRQRLADLARLWRDRESYRSAYERKAPEVEQRYAIASRVVPNENLLRAETFPCVDDLWRRELREAVGPEGAGLAERAGRLRAVAEARRGLFWARRRPKVGQAWEAVEQATRLFEGCREATRRSEELRTSEDFIRRYTQQDEWWRLDLWALELAALEGALDPEERSGLVLPAWQSYREFLDVVNRRFAGAVRREGWRPGQPGIWTRVEGVRERTAVFLVDALRFDLARRVAELLGGGFAVTVEPVRGVLPGITELGMASLLPGAEDGFAVEWGGDRVRVRLGEQEVGSREGRRARLQIGLRPVVKVVELEEVESADLAGAERLVVLSRELDEYGTFAAHLRPEGLLELLQRICRAVRLLADRGFQQFFLMADHGFLFVPPGPEPRTLPAGSARVVQPRFALGAVVEGCWTPKMSELGWTASPDEVIGFPVGLCVFSRPGPIPRFLHGGLSLQESIVPVLFARAHAPVPRITVTLEAPEPLTSRIAVVRVRAAATNLLAGSRRVRVRVGERESDPVEVGVGHPEATIQVRWLEFDACPPAEVSVFLVDADTGEVLEHRQARVELVV